MCIAFASPTLDANTIFPQEIQLQASRETASPVEKEVTQSRPSSPATSPSTAKLSRSASVALSATRGASKSSSRSASTVQRPADFALKPASSDVRMHQCVPIVDRLPTLANTFLNHQAEKEHSAASDRAVATATGC